VFGIAKNNFSQFSTIYHLVNNNTVCFTGTCSFLCQGTSTRRQRGPFSVFELSYHLLLPV